MLDLQEGKHFSWYVLWSPDTNGLPIQFLLVLLGQGSTYMVCLLPLGGKGQELKLVRGLGAPGSGSPATGLSSITGWRIGRHLALIFSSLVEGQKLPGLDLCCWKKDTETAGTTSTGGGACVLLPGVGWGMDWLPGFCCYHSCRQNSYCWHM